MTEKRKKFSNQYQNMLFESKMGLQMKISRILISYATKSRVEQTYIYKQLAKSYLHYFACNKLFCG